MSLRSYLGSFFRRPPEPILLHCLRCMHSTEITGPEAVPMNCPACGAEFGSRQQKPTGLITVPGTLTSDDVARIRTRWDEAIRARQAGLTVAFYAGEEPDCGG